MQSPLYMNLVVTARTGISARGNQQLCVDLHKVQSCTPCFCQRKPPEKKKKKEKKFDPRVVFFKRERERKKSPSTDRAAYVFDATARGVSVQPVAALDTEQSEGTFSHTQKTKNTST